MSHMARADTAVTMADPDGVSHPEDFDPQWYLSTYPDVAAAGLDPWLHYDRFGRAEGRRPRALPGVAAERDLWSGFAEAGRAELEEQARSPDPVIRDMALWALARWYAAQQDWPQADALCTRMVPTDMSLPPHLGIGQLVLAGNAALRMQDHARARAVLGMARQSGLSGTECDLLEANIDNRPVAALNRIWKRARLGGVRLDPGSAPAFDRLVPRRSMIPRLRRSTAPLVSVIVPAFNAAPTLTTALTSLVRQRWKALDIIVVDDGSTDDTSAVAQRLADIDPRIRILTSPENEGAYAARNRGAMAAQGAFITVLDADDWAHPDRIVQQVRVLIADPALVGSLSHWVRATPDLTFTRWRVEAEGLVHRNVSSLMVRRAVLDRVGVWDRVRAGADTEYYYRLISAYGGAALAEVNPGVPLSLGRQSGGSLTTHRDTHISSQIGGVRAAYLNAATRWHARAAGRPAEGHHPLYLPQHPDRRPFAVPEEVGMGDPEAALHPDDVIRRSPFFDAQWYLETNEDVRHAAAEPAQHYLNAGAAQDRDPSPRLSSSAYRLAYLQDSPDTNPLLHWHSQGREAGCTPLPRFDGAHAGQAPDLLVFGHQAGTELFGAERSLLDILGRMVASGQVPMVVLPQIRDRAYLEALRARSAAVQVLPYRWRRAGRVHPPDTRNALAALIDEVRPQEVHLNTLVLDAPAAAAKAASVPVTCHVRERPDQDADLCRALGADAATIRGWLLAEADRFVANSKGVHDWLAAPDRTEIVPNRIDRALLDVPAPSNIPPRVAMISSNIAKKGVADFVEMAHRLEDMGRTTPCLLVGPDTEDIKAQRPLPGSVETPGYAADAITALGQADIVVNLSRFAESFGRTVLEAMAAARPVVCYDRGHLSVLVEDGISGFLVPPDDPAAAAAAVARLIDSFELRQRMGNAARQRAVALLEAGH